MKIENIIPKSEARKLAIQRRTEYSESEIRKKTELLLKNLTQTEDFIQAKTVYCYIAGRPEEINSRGLIDLMIGWGKSVVLPKLNKNTKTFRRFNFTDWQDIIKNDEGFYEPKQGVNDDLSDIDLFLAPSVAVSKTGFRIGYGGGYYDKLLKLVHCPKFCPVFEFQIFNSIETTELDIRIDKIITERRIINTRNNNGLLSFEK